MLLCLFEIVREGAVLLSFHFVTILSDSIFSIFLLSIHHTSPPTNPLSGEGPPLGSVVRETLVMVRTIVRWCSLLIHRRLRGWDAISVGFLTFTKAEKEGECEWHSKGSSTATLVQNHRYNHFIFIGSSTATRYKITV
jgi:hypothetical protein